MRWKIRILTAVLAFSLSAPSLAMAAAGEEVRSFPGWNGAGPKGYGPGESYSWDGYYDDWFDDDDDDDDDDGPSWTESERGWRYNPNGWWFQRRDGSWPSATWDYIDGRWYRFSDGGHMITGWFQDGDGNSYYLNPVDDGTLGMMRTGWQLVDGKLYYFSTAGSGKEGSLLRNAATPDGYRVGADGVWQP